MAIRRNPIKTFSYGRKKKRKENMTNDPSFLCSIKLWTLKYGGLHEREIDVHTYQQKVDSSIFSFANSSEKNQRKKPLYHDEFNEFFTSRSMPLQLSNRIFANLRDKLTELDELFNNSILIRPIWLDVDLIFLVFSTGTTVLLQIEKITQILKKIHIDKTSLNKKFHVHGKIADFYLNKFGFFIIYENLSKLDIFRFQTPIRSFDSKFVLSNESVSLTSEELPPYSNEIPVRRYFQINEQNNTLTVWWSLLSEGFSTIRILSDGEQRKTRFNVFSILFPSENSKETEKTHSICTETINPFFCSSTPAGLTTVELQETSTKNPPESRYDLKINFYENFRSVPLRLVNVEGLSSSISFVIRSTKFTIVYLVDGNLISIDEINHVERRKRSVLSRNVTGIWWIVENVLFAIGDNAGAIVFCDVALNPIFPKFSSGKPVDFGGHLKMKEHVTGFHRFRIDSSTVDVLVQFSSPGPIGLMKIHFPMENLHSILKFYLISQNYSNAVDLLSCFDWSREDQDARLALSSICQDLFRNLNSTTMIFLEDALKTFYGPLRPIADGSILRNRSFVHQLATRFFYYLLREKFYSKALLLAKDLDDRTIFFDLYFAADFDNEKTIANFCAEKLSNGVSTNFDNDDTDLSVTSSDDETTKTITVRPKFSTVDTRIYQNVNEILSEAIENYQLDQNLHQLLSQRLLLSD